jgi:glyoxylase-like metal-dependent hydrolase (beta-lactamase superfamily II)
MTPIVSGLDYVDLEFLGYPNIIATAVLHGPGGVALVDPGPSTAGDRLLEELSRQGMLLADVTDVLVTHIHLDHSGGVGQLVRANPSLLVHVHEAGAPHLTDPSRLLTSAAKLYGADMERLWGQVLPVPAANIRTLAGRETIDAAGRPLAVAYTPGHAKHHVSFFDETTGIAFVGDTAGIRRAPGTYVMPPTPPPDIDLEAWLQSIDRVLAWKPSTLFITHFGPFDDPTSHADEFLSRLRAWAELGRELLAQAGLTDEQRMDRFIEAVRRDLEPRMSPEEADAYDRSGRIDLSWLGLARAIAKESRASA